MEEFLQQFQVSGIESQRFIRASSPEEKRKNYTTDGCDGDGCSNGCDPPAND